MQETGEVIAADGGFVTIRMQRTSACAHCQRCEAGANSTEMRVTAKNECAAAVNDWVQIELHPETFLSVVLALYGLPFIGLSAGFFAGYFFGTRMGWGDYSSMAGFVGGVLLAGLACYIVKRMEPRWRTKGYAPSATAVLQKHF